MASPQESDQEKSPLGDRSGLESSSDAVPLPVLPKERYDLRVLSSLRRIIRSVDVYSRRLAQEHGVTVPQLLCMLKIDECGPMTQKELSEAVYLNPSTIVGIVDRLEKADIFERTRSVRDRRRVRISLTENGIKMVEQSPSPLQESLAEGIAELPELERATIALSLERIIDLIEAGSEEVPTPEPIAEPVLETNEDLKESKGITPRIRE